MACDRLRYDENDCYYHIMNHSTYDTKKYLWNDQDKKMMVNIMKRLSLFYSVEIISYCMMSNHYHMVVYAPKQCPGLQEVKRRWRAHNESKKKEFQKPFEPNWKDPEVVAKLAKRMRDISWFARDFQQFFSVWYNQRNKRKGTLWARRFKSVILEQGAPVWDCIKYIEMNPLRAKMVRDTADYPFSSFGEYCRTGRHPFLANFAKHLGYFFGEAGKGWSEQQTCEELMHEFDACFQGESKKVYDEVSAEDYKNKPNLPMNKRELVFHKRFRQWNDAGIIGSKIFLQDVTEALYDKKRKEQKKFDQFGDQDMYAFRQLRKEE